MFATLTLYQYVGVVFTAFCAALWGQKERYQRAKPGPSSILDLKTVYIAQRVEGTVSQEVPSAKLIFLWSLGRLT